MHDSDHASWWSMAQHHCMIIWFSIRVSVDSVWLPSMQAQSPSAFTPWFVQYAGTCIWSSQNACAFFPRCHTVIADVEMTCRTSGWLGMIWTCPQSHTERCVTILMRCAQSLSTRSTLCLPQLLMMQAYTSSMAWSIR